MTSLVITWAARVHERKIMAYNVSKYDRTCKQLIFFNEDVMKTYWLISSQYRFNEQQGL